MKRKFFQLDVFGAEPFLGNPLAVVHNAQGLTAKQMQEFTRWTNLSECTFLLPPSTPEADYRVRIFTADRELPFAGHPTLGSCQAWLAAGGVPRQGDLVLQECGAGLIAVRLGSGQLAFAAPPLIRSGAVDAAYQAEVTAFLGVQPHQVLDMAWIDNGPGWVGVLLPDAQAVLGLEPSRVPYKGPGSLDVGVIGAYPAGHELAFELRGLYSGANGEILEDPVTGSLNASAAQWMLSTGRAEAPYIAGQGTALGREGRVSVEQDSDGTIWVGGNATICVEGWIQI